MFDEWMIWMLFGLWWALAGRRGTWRGWGCVRSRSRTLEGTRYRGEGSPPGPVRRAEARRELPRQRVEVDPEEALRREFVAGRLTVEEYEAGLDRLLGLREVAGAGAGGGRPAGHPG